MTVDRDAAYWLGLARWLEDDSDMQQLLLVSAQRDKQLLMRRRMTPLLPVHLTRTDEGNEIETPSGDAGDLLQNMVSQMASYSTKVRVVPRGTATQAKADRLEKHLAIKLGKLNEGSRLDDYSRARQAGVGWCVELYRYGPDNDCRAEVPDIYSMAFPNVDAPGRLPMYAMRFTKIVKDAVSEYRRRPRRAPGTISAARR